MARRGPNIYKRNDGRWEGRYMVGRKPDGTPRYRSIYGQTFGEVRDRLLPLKVAYMEQGPEPRNTNPFHEYLLADLAQKRASGIKASSYDSYYRTVHKHIMPALGHIRMHHLTTQHVRQFLSDLHGKGLSDSTIYSIYRYQSSVTRAAAKTGAMARDICADITLAKPKPKKVRALSRAEQKRLEVVAVEAMEKGKGQGLEALLALYAGLRVGEISALQWEDIDFSSGIIHVRHTMQRLTLHDTAEKTTVRVGTPKSESSERDVPLGDYLSKALLKHRRLTPGKYVITSRRRDFAEPRVLQYRFERLLKLAEIPHVGFHTTRHSFATRCMEFNTDIAAISGLLGHSSVKQTSDTYIDSLYEQRVAAVNKLDALALAG